MTERLDIALTVLCLAGFCATLLAMVVRIAAPFVTERARGAAKRIGGGGLVMLAFACAAILYGGSKPSQTEKSQAEAVPDTVSTANAVASPALPVSRVYPLTTSSASLTIDEQTAAHPFVGEPALVGKWWRRGAYEDGEVVEIPASAGWCFPWRGGHLTRFEIWASGAVYASERDAEPVVRLRSPLSLKPMSSRVVHGFTTNSAYRIEWREAHPNRDAANVADAAIELRRNGDVAVMENGVEVLVPYEIPFAHDGFGQDEEWVRANCGDTADDALAVGYSAWVDEQVGVGLANGLYRFTATFAEPPPEPIRLVVGDLSVCVTKAGVYSFLLKKGINYKFWTSPHVESVRYEYADDAPSGGSVLRAAAARQDGGRWTVDGGDVNFTLPTPTVCGEVLWMPTLQGFPDVAHIGPGESPVNFWASLSDIAPGVNVGEFSWTASEPLELSATTGSSVDLYCERFPSWKEACVTVSTMVMGRELTSVLSFTYGEHDRPQAVIRSSVPTALLLRSDWIEDSQSAMARVALLSDVETNGVVRVSVVNGADKVSVGNSALGDHRLDDTTELSLAFPIDGIAVSAEVDDVALVCEYIDAEGKVVSSVSNLLTVVSPKLVAVNGDAVQDVAVLLGSSLSMEVVAEPSASVIPSVSWCDAKLLADRTYTDWRNWRTYGRKVSRTMGESGVFAIKARAQFPGPQWTDVKYVWTEDEDQTIGFRRAGDVNHVGVASTQAQLDLRAAARARLGDTDYAFEVMLPARNGFSGLKKNSWKCNAFVADVAISAGLNVPIQHRTGVALIYERCYPPVANEWANGTVKIDGWQFLGNDVCPEPGLVIGHPAPSGPGHVGIVDFDGEGIAAGEFKVTRQYKAFLDGTSGFNRYVGTQEGGQDE